MHSLELCVTEDTTATNTYYIQDGIERDLNDSKVDLPNKDVKALHSANGDIEK